jgi:hypothetical protein
MPDKAPWPRFHPGEQVIIWIDGVSPHPSAIRHLGRIREGEWWYVCTRRSKQNTEYSVLMPEKWITYPDESPPSVLR